MPYTIHHYPLFNIQGIQHYTPFHLHTYVHTTNGFMDADGTIARYLKGKYMGFQ